jgi:hypothetical protein
VTSLEVELWSASAFAQQTVTFTNSGKLQRLRGLGRGAFYFPVKGSTNASSLYPTEKQYLTLARAIHKHLG